MKKWIEMSCSKEDTESECTATSSERSEYTDDDDEEEEEEEEEKRGAFEDSEDDDEDCETDAMAIALSPGRMSTTLPSAHENGISVIQRANRCTVLNGSRVVNNFKQSSPNMHSQYISQGNDHITPEVKRLEPVYVETRGARECMDVLESENALVIVGNPGEGKTTTSIMTVNKLMKKGFKPVVLTSPNEWNSKVVQAEESEKLVLFIDDMFGKVGVDEHNVNEWLAINEIISQYLVKREGSAKIICTMRKKIYNATKQRLKRFTWFRTFRVVDISAETYAMGEHEKGELLQKYFKHYAIPKESWCTQAAQCTPPHGFPHCVELYCTEPNCKRMGMAFFVSPLSAVEREIETLNETRSTQYYALLLVHLSPCQKVNVDIMSGEQEFDKTLLNKTRLLSKLPTKDGMDIVRAIEKLTDIYLKEDDHGSIMFKHDSISEIIGVIATRNSPIPAVNYLNLQFLAEKTKYLTYKEDDRDEYAILPKKATLRLVVRLTESLLSGEAFSACKHHAWDNIDFLDAWLDYVNKNESETKQGNTLLDELMTTPLETYTVMQRNSNSRPAEIQVGLMFLLYLNKKEVARQEILNLYQKEAMGESEKLTKFRREIRCSSGRKLKHPSSTHDEDSCRTGVN